MRVRGRGFGAGAGMVLVALTFATGAEAATYVVDSNGDEPDAGTANSVCATVGGSCTLRAAIGQSEGSGSPGADTITFSVTGAIDLLTALPPITKELHVLGPGASQLTVRRAAGAPPFAIFVALPPAGTPNTIAGLTITNGQSPGPAGGGGISGGAGQLTVRDAVVKGNNAPGGSIGVGPVPGTGGGIQNLGGSLTVVNSAITDNRAAGADGFVSGLPGGGPTPGSSGLGGGIYSAGPLTIVRSTVSGNSVSGGKGANGTLGSPNGGAGGDALGAGVYASGSAPIAVIIENSTISGNTAGPAGAGGSSAVLNNPPAASGLARGGGISLDGSASPNPITATITDSTIAGNTAPSGANLGLRAGPGTPTLTIRGTLLVDPINSGNCEAGGAAITSGGFNLEDATPSTCSFTQPTDIAGPDPGLLPLADNGGVGQTHAFSKASPVVDAGNAFGLVVDQRGLARPFGFGDIADATGGDGSDIGAFELQATACEDGHDNDADGKIDLVDPGCAEPADSDEADPPPAQCTDGTDNDGDGKTDLADPGCTDASDNDESDATAAPKCAGRDSTIVASAGQAAVGTPGDDVIVGTDAADTIRAGGGADTICALGGADKVKGAGGNDRIVAGGGNDRVGGGGGGDRLRGSSGDDRLGGNAGNDDLAGGPGKDKLNGGPGRDKCAGERGGVLGCER